MIQLIKQNQSKNCLNAILLLKFNMFLLKSQENYYCNTANKQKQNGQIVGLFDNGVQPAARNKIQKSNIEYNDIQKFRGWGLNTSIIFSKNVLYHMQQKIQKLFTFFRNIKNEPFYTSCISQIIEVYENCPESLKFILYNMKQLLFVSAKESNLRFKHRKICASIISKLNMKYVSRVHAFLSDKESFEIQSFQLDSKETKTDFSFKVSSWTDKDYIKILKQAKPLYSSSKDYDENETVDPASSQKTFFEQFHQIKQATMMNMQQLILGMKLDEGQEQKDAYAGGGKKYQDKINKFKLKNDQKFQSNELFISNPFNLMFQICLENMLSPEWELRHLSVLIIKQIITNAEFLGFMEPITIPKMKSPQQRFNEISNITRNLLIQHLDKTHIKTAIYNEVCQNAIELLCLDRFADYQSDASNIIVRAEGAQILKICFQTLNQQEKIKMLKLIKKLLDLQQSKTCDYTWQLRHSFIYFLSLLTQKQANVILIYKLLDQSLFRVLSTNQTDEITLCVCQIFNKCVGQSFFNQKAMKRVNQQLWNVIEQQDDIAVATKQVLSLLKRMFCVFDLNESDCLDKIKKFFVSKIPEVRKELYSLLIEIFSRNFSINTAILDKYLILFMQAIIVENDQEILQQLEKLAPEIMKHILHTKKLGRVNYFISSIMLDQQYLSTLIEKHFKVYENGSNLGSNDYLYIAEEERITVSLQIYMDKRCSKMARILAKAFNQSLDGLSDIVKYIQNQNLDDKRATMFIFNLYCQIFKSNNAKQLQSPYFKGQISKASMLLNLDVNKIDDPDIKYQKNQFINSVDKITSKHQSLKEAIQHFKKAKWDGKEITVLHEQLCIYYNNLATDDDQLKYSIALLTNITDLQKKLFGNIKVLCCYFIVKIHRIINEIPKNDISKLINSLAQTLQQQRYAFVSQFLSLSLVHLSELLCIKKNIKLYQKITKRFIKVLSSSYKHLEISIKLQPNNFKFASDFMEAGKNYVLKVGQNIPTWIEDYQQYILEGLEYFNGDEQQLALLRLKSLPSEGNSVSVEGNQQKCDEQRNPLKLLSGIIQSLLALESQKFLTQLLKKLTAIISMPENEKNYSLLCVILEKIFLYFSENYTNNANLFFSWYLQHIKSYNRTFYAILSTLGLQSIVKIAPVSSLFIMQIVRSISIVNVQDIAMGILSNLLVGVYMNFIELPFSPQLLEESKEGIEFVKNFKDAGKFNYEICVKLEREVELRNYQIQGISWLGFLTKYNLNGALCDDMGLGKTIQMLILIQNQYSKMVESKQKILQSLIVVPTTIMQHWKYEYYKYFSDPVCKIQILQQSTDLVDEQKIRSGKKPKIFITNYNFLDKNIGFFSERFFKFIVLDEGHIIKNIKTKKFKSVKKLKSLHRFILTGTPIQNRLKQLWGLFDFLMPGYLYTEEIFNKYYQKLFQVNLTTFKQDQLLFSENQRKTLEKLHFKVMPFIMRRMKTEVLKQLPSKIINDYYCEMTKVQEDLYSQFYENSFGQRLKQTKLQQGNTLKSLIEMQKILNHPSLMGESDKFQDSGKFLALAQLFQQLGLTESDSSLQNKVIIFSRSNKLIELLQTLFMKNKFPNVKYLKLTGSTKVSNRFSVAQTFNGDIDIKVLLVTTKVGGEGLNLCSANTVVMFDHDYNPTVDMQAIDRAHRIGQRRVVNVYRLITKNTLQQKIMGIQKFKTNLANAIVNIDNASIKNIKNSKLPDLLQHIRDQSQQTRKKVDKSFVHSIMEQIQKNAITEEDYKKKY